MKGFKKVFLKAGEEKEVSIDLEKRAFAFYNVDAHDWQVESGEFKILVGASSRDIRLEASLNVESTVAYAVPDYHKMAPSYYGADIMNVSDEEFTAVLGHEIPLRYVIRASRLITSTPLRTLRTASGAAEFTESF